MSSFSMGVLGGIVGFAIGGFPGAVAGFEWGRHALDGKDQRIEGPQLGDNRVQSSTQGKAIPLVYGTTRIAGNLIWASELKKTQHTSSQESPGGKGGGGGGGTTTTVSYTYSVDCAISICNNAVAGVGKIWADGQLIHNESPPAPANLVSSGGVFKLFYEHIQAAQASEAAAAAARMSTITVYSGSETQLPNATIEAYLGIGNVPAYRGQAYVMITNLQLEKYGNRIPNIEFEVISAGSPLIPAGSVSSYPADLRSITPYSCCFDQITNSVWVSEFSYSNVYKIDITTGGVVTFPVAAQPVDVCFDPTTNSVWTLHATAVNKVNCATGGRSSFATTGTISTGAGIYFDQYSGAVWATSTGTLMRFETLTGTRTDYKDGFNPSYAMGDMTSENVTNSLWIVCGPANTLHRLNKSTGMVDAYATLSNPSGIAFDPINNCVWIGHLNALFVSKFDVNTGTRTDYATTYQTKSATYDSITKSMWFINSNTSYQLQNVNLKTFAVSIVSGLPVGSAVMDICFDPVSYKIWGASQGVKGAVSITVMDRGITSASSATVGSIVSDLCARVGATSVDTSQLTDIVSGYSIGGQCTARAAIEPLQRAFFFDAVESDSLIKFVKRGIVEPIIIPVGDLAAHSPQEKDIQASILLSQTQEVELPKTVNVSFYNADNNYLQGNQRATRQVTRSVEVVDLKFAVCMSDTKAKQLASTYLYMSWAQRNQVTFKTSRKYAYLNPSDVVTVTKENGITYNIFITKRNEQPQGIIEWEGVADDQSCYTQAVTASAPAVLVPSEVAGIVATRVEFLDIPMLRDMDNDGGFYTAANGYTTGWSGGQLFRSNDGGSTYTPSATLPVPAPTMGWATTALETFSGKNIFDENSSVTVQVVGGTLSSVSELSVLNGSNFAVLGNELFQYKNATLVAANTYTLSGLLRARFGTEQYISGHVIGDRFVALSTAAMQRIVAGSDAGLQRTYKAVSNDQLLSAVPMIPFTNTSAALKPLSPVSIGGGRDASFNWTINWMRRTRFVGGWANGSDVPLNEATESYSIDIMQGAVLKRTLTSTTPTVSYTAAMQTTDFGGLQSTLLVNIYQISATVGRGFVGVATL